MLDYLGGPHEVTRVLITGREVGESDSEKKILGQQK